MKVYLKLFFSLVQLDVPTTVDRRLYFVKKKSILKWQTSLKSSTFAKRNFLPVASNAFSQNFSLCFLCTF